VALRGTSDARGFRQWQEAGRQVRKGAKALHILVPRFSRSEDEDTREEERKLIGFVSAAVFAIEDTDGPALPETVPPQVPKLRELADRLGIPVIYAGAASDRLEGVYTHKLDDGDGATGRITLYTHGLDAFYHELAHALHHRTGKLRNGSDPASKRDNEIVAEVSAAVLVRLFEGEEMGRRAIAYIRDYGATKTRLLAMLPEILGVASQAIRSDSVAASVIPLDEPEIAYR
jgi:antirestriction protein ArdC